MTSTITPGQPTLPAELPFTDAEQNYLDESPPGLYPENQNSNYGLFRRLFSDRVQELIDQQLLIYNERFVATSIDFIDEWEREYGLPVAPTGRSLAQRRQDVLARIAKGPFTRSRRAAVVEAFISATFGTPIILTPPGVPLDPAGTPLYSEAGSLTTLYKIVEDIPNYFYHVRIKNTLVPDIPGLTRELTRITPSGISFDVLLVATP